MVGRRHAAGEVAAKLAQAKELAARGKTQHEIAKALGVSVMTYHRWRKSGPDVSTPKDVNRNAPQTPTETSGAVRSEEASTPMELENLRLRRLVTDLLLEKLDLEEQLRGRDEARSRKGR